MTHPTTAIAEAVDPDGAATAPPPVAATTTAPNTPCSTPSATPTATPACANAKERQGPRAQPEEPGPQACTTHDTHVPDPRSLLATSGTGPDHQSNEAPADQPGVDHLPADGRRRREP